MMDFLVKPLSEIAIPTAKTELWKFTNFENLFLGDSAVSVEPTIFSPLTYPNTMFVTKEKVKLNSESCIKISQSNDLATLELKELAAHFENDYVWNKTILELKRTTIIEISQSCTLLMDIFAQGQDYQQFIFVVEPDCRVEIIEDIKSATNPSALVKHIIVIAKKNSKVEFVSLHRAQENFKSLDYTSFFTDESEIKSFAFNFGGEISRKNYYGKIFGANSHLEISGLYTLKNSTHLDINSLMIHESADTTAEQIFKGLIDDDAKGIFTGKIHIKKDSQRVSAKQLNKNILMSKKAHVHSCPQLEIYADDVKCSHGSTTGKISDDELFYLQSRGINAERAKALLTQGFAQDIIFRLKDQKLQSFLIENFHAYFGEKLQ